MTLDQAPVGAVATIGPIDAAPAMLRRLAELGVRTGEAVTPLHATAGGGRLLAVGDTRVALARDVLRRIEVVAP
ncbi:MAG: ferrous iron transport protein A [Actinobacteria bacterium]|nr:ferrous iron transport protein A [Actinomycetota bacterium]